MTPGKPLPVADDGSTGYWDAAARGELALPRCSACGHVTMPPTVVCRECGSTDAGFAYVGVNGSGTVRSWTVVRDAFLHGFEHDVPYLLVDVELDAQPHVRMIGRLRDGPDARLQIGDRVTATFDEIGDGVAVPSFALTT